MLDGICAMPVQVEVDISMGMPVFDMVGYLFSGGAGGEGTSAYGASQLRNSSACKADYRKSFSGKYKENRNRI